MASGTSTRGRPPHPDVLTPAEWRIAHAIRHGMRTKTIAQRQGVSVDAVKYHVANILRKLDLDNRAQLRAWTGIPADSALRATAAARPPAPGDTTVINDSPLGRVGQISRRVSDIETAVAWYRDVLGLPHLYTFGDLAFFDLAGTRLFLTAAAEGPSEPGESVVYFRVDDIHTACAALTARGVAFLGAPHLIHRHESGVEEWMAFFQDPDGRTLALMAQTGVPGDAGAG